MRQAKPVSILKEALFWLLLVLVVIPFLFPFFWMILSSLKTQVQIMQVPPTLIFTPTWRNYQDVFGQQNFLYFMTNSFIVATGSTLVGLILGLPAAYSIARYKQQGLGFVILLARMVPGITFLILWFIMFTRLHLIDTYTALIASHLLVALPFITWVMIPFFEGIPVELEEAARVDGTTTPYAFLRIVLPLSGPGIITASILSFVFSWNNFMFVFSHPHRCPYQDLAGGGF